MSHDRNRGGLGERDAKGERERAGGRRRDERRGDDFYERNYKPRLSGSGNEPAVASVSSRRHVDRVFYPSPARNKIELYRNTAESRTPKIRNYPSKFDSVLIGRVAVPAKMRHDDVAADARGSRYFLFATTRVWRALTTMNGDNGIKRASFGMIFRTRSE